MDDVLYEARTIKRFWAKVRKTDDCWEWTGAKSTGYARFVYKPNGELYTGYAHRYSYELHVGPVAPGMQVDHICWNRACVRPDHLRLASSKQNNEHRQVAKNNKSGYRGVSWDSNREEWVAHVGNNGRIVYVGRFSTAAEAASAAREARLRMFSHNDEDRQVSVR